MKFRRVLLVLCAMFCVGPAVKGQAQPEAETDSVAALRDLIAGGYYALAAQVDGPQVVRAHPQSGEAHLLYARALYLVGNLEAAAAQLNRAKGLANSPDLQRSVTHLGALVQAAQGNPESAVRQLAQLFAASADYEVAMDWGQVAWQSGNLGAALRAYRAAGNTASGETEPWPSLNEARLLLLQKNYREAITTLGTTLTILEAAPTPRPSPAYAEAFYRLGEAHEALGETDDAISNYQAASSVAPDYLPARKALERLGTR